MICIFLTNFKGGKYPQPPFPNAVPDGQIHPKVVK